MKPTMNAKDFYIEYEQEHGTPPTEEEWLAYYDDMVEHAEALKYLNEERESNP